MPADSFVFKRGKHAGQTYGIVKKIDYQYILWAEVNAPGLLKESKPKEIPTVPGVPSTRKEVPEDSEVVKSSMQPNLDFLKQVGDSHFKKEDKNDNNKN